MKPLVTSLVALFCMATSFTFAKNTATLTGKVLDPDGAPVEFANVILYMAADSSLAKVETTGIDGAFTVAGIDAGAYWLKITYVGLADYQTEIFQLTPGEEKTFGIIQLAGGAAELAEVEVVAERPLLEVRPDKMVFNVDGSVNASGSTALELLRKAPGVVVDNNDNISLLGRSGVQIYIDGKPSPLGTADLAAFLRSLQSTEIDAIEIINNPSAKYDAEGNAGIINIRLKKDKSLGANANLNLGGSQGEVAQYNGTLSGNYRNKELNTFGSYSYNDGSNLNWMDLYREQFGQRFEQTGEQGGSWQSHNFKFGTDFFLSEQHTVGFLINGFLSDTDWGGDSRTLIGPTAQGTVDRVLVASSDDLSSRNNANFNINYRFENKKGVSWNIDADYGLFRNDGRQFQPNRYYDGSETNLLDEVINTMNMPTDIDIYAFKMDHERSLLGGQFGAGFKVSFVQTDNDFAFFNIEDGTPVLDVGQSNRFLYDENVHAGYFTFSRQLDKFGVNLGLRVEQTNSTGDLRSMVPTDNDYVERNYTDLFPSAGLTFTPSQKHNFQLRYSRRINRPSYQDLNPFRGKLDELTFEQGNPFLRPEYANNFQLTHTYNYRLNTTIGYSHTRDLITRLTDIDPQNNDASFITWLNLADQYSYNASVSAPLPITEWWSSFTNTTLSHTINRADYGDGKVVDLDATTFNIYSQQTFRLPGDLSLEMSGWYNSPSLWGGTFEMGAMWSIDAGIQKKVMDGRGTLRLAISDIFKTNEWNGVARFGELFMNVGGGWDSRRVRLNFSYMLGNTQVKGARKRTTGLEDEKSRVKSGN